MSPTCSRRNQRELARDETVLAAQLLRGLSRILMDTLTARLVDPTSAVDLCQLHEQLAEALDRSIQRHVQLQDRWAHRRPRPRDSRPLPPSVRPFRHRGTYLGAFRSLKAVAARVLKGGPRSTNLYDEGIDLHLAGSVWTVEADGMLHAFLTACPPVSTAKNPPDEE